MRKKAVTFRLSEKAIEVLRFMSCEEGVSQTQFLEKTIVETDNRLEENDPKVTVYGLRHKGHIYYVGSTLDFEKRITTHRALSGKKSIRDVINAGGEFFVIKECTPEEGFAIERSQIETLKAVGMCDLNHTLPSKNGKRNTAGLPVMDPKTKRTWESKAAAGRFVGVSQTTIGNWIKEGRFKEL